jgi:hypothetical protein
MRLAAIFAVMLMIAVALGTAAIIVQSQHSTKHRPSLASYQLLTAAERKQYPHPDHSPIRAGATVPVKLWAASPHERVVANYTAALTIPHGWKLVRPTAAQLDKQPELGAGTTITNANSCVHAGFVAFASRATYKTPLLHTIGFMGIFSAGGNYAGGTYRTALRDHRGRSLTATVPAVWQLAPFATAAVATLAPTEIPRADGKYQRYLLMMQYGARNKGRCAKVDQFHSMDEMLWALRSFQLRTPSLG